jgi:hypothetical protein
VERKSRSDASNNRGSRNDLRIILKIREQNTGKARNQGTTVNNHIEYCARNSKSTRTRVCVFIVGNKIIGTKILTTE